MRVFTYYQQLKGISAKGETALLSAWEKSWQRMGWTPVVLSAADAQAEDPELFAEIASSEELGRGNLPPGYAHACHLRWLAHRAYGGLHVDYDVVNRSFTPGDMERLLSLYGIAKPLVLMPWLCPCAVWANKAHCGQMIQAILDQRDDQCREGELSHCCHDQAVFAVNEGIFQKVAQKQCEDWRSPGWRETPLVHFPNRCTPSPRYKIVEQEMGL